MKQVGVVLLAFALLLQVAQAAGSKNEAEAESASKQWLTLVDTGKYAESWTAASSLFRNRITKEKWVDTVKGVREPLGAATPERTLIHVTLTKSLPGMPDGDYAVVQFKTKFEKKAEAVETVSLALEDGGWKTIGYFIR